MLFPIATSQMPLSCEAAMSDAVLQAATAAMPADPLRWMADADAIRKLGPKNEPLVPLLMALLDSAQAVAAAIADNAWDSSLPLSKELSSDLATQAVRISTDILSGSDCPNAANWSLPSMTGKEFV
jgi:hypothetical protein